MQAPVSGALNGLLCAYAKTRSTCAVLRMKGIDSRGKFAPRRQRQPPTLNDFKVWHRCKTNRELTRKLTPIRRREAILTVRQAVPSVTRDVTPLENHMIEMLLSH